MRDPADIAVVQTAVSGDADCICTLDSDFYDLKTVAYCSAAGIRICSDVELLRELLTN